jgi:hypothetical protein
MLINGTLSSLPTNFLSFFPLPAGVAVRLEHLQMDFLWDGLRGAPKFHIVK